MCFENGPSFKYTLPAFSGSTTLKERDCDWLSIPWRKVGEFIKIFTVKVVATHGKTLYQQEQRWNVEITGTTEMFYLRRFKSSK